MDKKVHEKLEEAVSDNESLQAFLLKMHEFTQQFCNKMGSGTDFTLRLEVHGNKGQFKHAKLTTDDVFRVPPLPSGKPLPKEKKKGGG